MLSREPTTGGEGERPSRAAWPSARATDYLVAGDHRRRPRAAPLGWGSVAIFEQLHTLAGDPLDPSELDGRAVLVVNVASKCGLTPQYTGLEALQERYADRGFTVLGVPCNQFAGQEPGTAEEIQQFCATTYGASFPLTEKLEVNGRHCHPLYERLTAVADAEGRAGEVEWNFEKFLISPAGEIVARFRPQVEPEDAQVTRAIQRVLP